MLLARRIPALTLLIAVAIAISACGRSITKAFDPLPEYEEELYLALDGTVTLNVNASVASLVALRGVDLPVDPRAQIDREKVRALYEAPGAETVVSLSRRDGRRFVHVSVDAPDLRTLGRMAPFAWSRYRFERRGDSMEYRQLVGGAAAKPVDGVGWSGAETVMFRIHVPSEIDYHNAPSRQTERGNILVWEQPLSERLKGTPIDIEVQMQSTSILADTLLLFGSTILAAAAVFVLAIWWVSRRGRGDAATT